MIEFSLPGEGALSVALAAGQLHVAVELLGFMLAKEGSAPPIFTAEQVERIVRMWAIDHTHHAPEQRLGGSDVVRLFTLLVLCTRPPGAPPLRHDSNKPAKMQRRQRSSRFSTGRFSSAGGITPINSMREKSTGELSIYSMREKSAGELSTILEEKRRAGESPQPTPKMGRPSIGTMGPARGIGTCSSLPTDMSFGARPGNSNIRPPPLATFQSHSMEELTENQLQHAAVYEEDADEEDLGRTPPNPVLLSLQLASSMRLEANHFSGDGVVSDQLQAASTLLQHVASGLVDGAVRASDEKEEVNRSFNPWRTGNDPVEPRIARDFFVRMSLPIAAEQELKVFVSNPFVYSHLQHLFWPEAKTTARGEEMRVLAASHSRFVNTLLIVGMLIGHVLVLPVLLVLPRRYEVELEEILRDQIMSRKLPIGIIWFFPAGRFALWCIATACLAWLLTGMAPPPGVATAHAASLAAEATPSQPHQLASSTTPSSTLEAIGSLEGIDMQTIALVSMVPDEAFSGPFKFSLGGVGIGGPDDLMLLLYACGWSLAELTDLLTTESWRTYIGDVFNMLDIILILMMLATFTTRLLTINHFMEGTEALSIMLPCQAVTAMLAWLRLLQAQLSALNAHSSPGYWPSSFHQSSDDLTSSASPLLIILSRDVTW